MSPYLDLIRSISVKYNEKVTRYCDTLFKHFNFGHFWVSRIKNSGHFACLNSKINWSEYWEEEKLYLEYPLFCHPKYLDAGIYLHNPSDPQNQFLGRIGSLGRDQFNLHLWLRIVAKTDEGVEEFGFCTQSSSEHQISLLLNGMTFIQEFIKAFKTENQFLFTQFETHQIDLAQLVGPSFYKPTAKMPRKMNWDPDFLKTIKVDSLPELSSRELDVSALILIGYSASQIAEQLRLSKRTIEHHIERIKEKLECSAKSTLIQKLRKLEHLGLFQSCTLFNHLNI